MPPRRSTKAKAAPKRTRSKQVEEEEVPVVVDEVTTEEQMVEEPSVPGKGKAPSPQIPVEQEEPIVEDARSDSGDAEMAEPQPGPSSSTTSQPLTAQERAAKLEALRLKMVCIATRKTQKTGS